MMPFQWVFVWIIRMFVFVMKRSGSRGYTSPEKQCILSGLSRESGRKIRQWAVIMPSGSEWYQGVMGITCWYNSSMTDSLMRKLLTETECSWLSTGRVMQMIISPFLGEATVFSCMPVFSHTGRASVIQSIHLLRTSLLSHWLVCKQFICTRQGFCVISFFISRGGLQRWME